MSRDEYLSAPQWTKGTRSTPIDVYVRRDGWFFLFDVQSIAAEQWIDAHVLGAHWFDNALVVPHRYALEFTRALIDAGFTVR